MEPGGRKILPRIPPSPAGTQDRELDSEPTRQHEEGGRGVNGHTGKVRIHLKQWPPAHDTSGTKRRKLNVVDSRAGSQTLPGVQQLLTVPTAPNAPDSQMAHPSRLIRSQQNGQYYSHGVFIFQAPAPPYGRDFPAELTHDQRPFSFAQVEPELMDIFKHTWYLRQYVRQRRAQGVDGWWDHIQVNDTYGIMNTLQSWSSRYEPGTLHYPASMLYKNVLWLYASRSIQPSIATTGYRQVVEDGLHFLCELEQVLGDSDRSFLLVPIFLLGASAFENRQRSPISRSLEKVAAPGAPDGIFGHTMTLLNHIWDLMSEGRASETWDWERLQNPLPTQNVHDRTLVELLRDPFVPEYPVPRVRSPEAMADFDPNRFRAAPVGNQAPVSNGPGPDPNTRTSSGDAGQLSPSQGISPNNAAGAAFADPSQSQQAGLIQERAPSQQQFPQVYPARFIAPPPSGMTSMQQNVEMLALNRSRLVKARSMVPPCNVCGKELKNPSDAQKHSLQHSKPFHCKEPGCTRNLGFATENDLQRHRKSVHNASPRIGNKIGYVCVQCPEPSDGTQRKWWPRLDNFKAHIRRKHHGADEEGLIQASSTPRRPEDTFTDSGYWPGSDPQGQYATPPDRQQQLSISDASGAERDSEQPASAQEGQSQEPRQAQDEDDDEDGEDEDDEEGDDDGPVGPWELSKSFRTNGKRNVSSSLSPGASNGVGDGEQSQSPMAGRSREGSVLTDSTPRAEAGAGAAVDGAAEAETEMEETGKVAEEAGNRDSGDRMEVDTAETEEGRDEEPSRRNR